MSKIELISKKSKKLAPVIVANDNNGYSNLSDWSNITTEKLASKRLKPIIKSGMLFQYRLTDNEIAIFAVEDKLAVDGTHHITYWKTPALESYNVALNNLVETLSNMDIKNIVIYFNKNDNQTISKFNGNNKVMVFDGGIYISNSTDASGNDEWESANIGTFDSLFKNDSDNEFKEYVSSTNNTKETVTAEESAQVTEDQVETVEEVSNEPTSTTEEQIQEEPVVEQEPTEEINLDQETTYQAEAIEEQPQKEQVPSEEPKKEINWADEFFKLKGDHDNGILSNEERFKGTKVQNAYAKLDEKSNKIDTGSLQDLKNSSNRVGQSKGDAEDNYEATRKMVLENLKKLSEVNKQNNDLTKNTFKEEQKESIGKKVSTDDLLNKIQEMKAKLAK